MYLMSCNQVRYSFVANEPGKTAISLQCEMRFYLEVPCWSGCLSCLSVVVSSLEPVWNVGWWLWCRGSDTY